MNRKEIEKQVDEIIQNNESHLAEIARIKLKNLAMKNGTLDCPHCGNQRYCLISYFAEKAIEIISQKVDRIGVELEIEMMNLNECAPIKYHLACRICETQFD